ncbi:MAG: FtsQ-type POTRA domain-containing protein [Eubacteriales bacterium]
MKQQGKQNPYRRSAGEEKKARKGQTSSAYERAKLLEQNRREREEFLRQQDQGRRKTPPWRRQEEGEEKASQPQRSQANPVRQKRKKQMVRPTAQNRPVRPPKQPLTEAQKRRRSLLFRLGLAGCALLVLVILSCTVLFPIRKIEVVGNSRYTAEEIQLASGIREEQNLFRAGVGYSVKAIEQQFPYISEVKLQRRLPGTLRIVVTEAQPQCMLKIDGQYLVLDEQGRVLEKTADVEGMKIPIAVAGEGASADEGALIYPERPDMLKLHQELCEGLAQRDLLDKITYLTYVDRFDIRLLYDNRIEVKLGNQTDLEKKLDSLVESLSMLADTDTGTLSLNSTELNRRYFLPKEVADIFPWWERAMDRVTVVEGQPITSPAPLEGGSLGTSTDEPASTSPQEETQTSVQTSEEGQKTESSVAPSTSTSVSGVVLPSSGMVGSTLPGGSTAATSQAP